MPFFRTEGGWLELIVGPMFSGKSEELIRRVTRALIAKQQVQVFKPKLDNRYDAVAVASHNGRTLDALAIADVSEVGRYLEDDTRVVAFDEGQFLTQDLVALALDLADDGKRVIVG
ncbi:MAG: thymidine kinase, partial [Trueperaceae bacterium]|nr:thymidine kinase [Trueperaceae bacterium]